MSGARSRRLLFALAVLAIAGSNPRMEGDDSPAANEGARVAVRASYFIDPNGSSHNWPKNTDVQAATQGHAVAAVLADLTRLSGEET